MLLSSKEKLSTTLIVLTPGGDLGHQPNLSPISIIKSVRAKFELYLKESFKAQNSSMLEMALRDLSRCKLKLSMASSKRLQPLITATKTYRRDKGKAHYLEPLYSIINTRLLANLL
jgi:hypothetical protein